MSKSKKILVILTGSIACYKVAHVISRLKQAGHQVQVAATKNALQFLGEATLEGLSGTKVFSDLYQAGEMMGHIHLARWADLILVAPATANYINKMAAGQADDLASTLFLSHDFKKPFLVVPAMNTSMYIHPITQASIQKLNSFGIEFLETASGVLACGEAGFGKLLDPELILNEVIQKLDRLYAEPAHSFPLGLEHQSTRILVTAGGTKEKIDSVRSLTNSSTGKTGYDIAQSLFQLGYSVDLVLSKSSAYAIKDFYYPVEFFETSEDLNSVLSKKLSKQNYSHVIHLAAVSDFSVDKITSLGKSISQAKISSDLEEVCIHLKRNPKIISSLRDYSKNKDVKIIGFKLTSGASTEEQKRAVENLFKQSSCDLVVHNDQNEILNNIHPFYVYAPNLSSIKIDSVPELLTQILQTTPTTETKMQRN